MYSGSKLVRCTSAFNAFNSTSSVPIFNALNQAISGQRSKSLLSLTESLHSSFDKFADQSRSTPYFSAIFPQVTSINRLNLRRMYERNGMAFFSTSTSQPVPPAETLQASPEAENTETIDSLFTPLLYSKEDEHKRFAHFQSCSWTEVEEYFAQQQSLPCNQSTHGADWVNILTEKISPNSTSTEESQYRFAFNDNSLSIAQLHGSPPRDSPPASITTPKVPPKEVKVLLIRPLYTGKSFFGKTWLEFLKGDPKNRLDRTLLKQRYHDLFPKPGEIVCVHLDFSYPWSRPMRNLTAWNKALQAAGLPELSISDDNTDPFERFILSLKQSGKRAAFFIDDYDHLARTDPDELQTTKQLFERIKKYQEVIPYCYVTGSSRLMLAGIFSGANSITDLSYEQSWATTFGYTWENIQQIYGQQLDMFARLHRVTPEQLKERMEYWYGGYYFSPKEQTKSVSLLLPINRFISTGHFRDSFPISPESKIYMRPSWVFEHLFWLLKEGKIDISADALENYRCTPPLSLKAMDFKMLLLTDGALSLRPASTESHFELSVPNRSAMDWLNRYQQSLCWSTIEKMNKPSRLIY